jgi:DNA-directed RNA polymerase subunit RPC12/RpoP
VQRGMSGRGEDRTPARPCPRCGAQLRTSHREYAGRGQSTMVLRCAACGHTVSGAARSDSERAVRARRVSSKHRPVDEGPPSNPVIDPDVAARLLEELGP